MYEKGRTFSSPCALDHKERKEEDDKKTMEMWSFSITHAHISIHLFSSYPWWSIYHVLCCDHVPLINTIFYRVSDSVALFYDLASSSLFIYCVMEYII